MRKFSDIIAHIFYPRRSNNHRAKLLHSESLFFLVLTISGFVALLHLFSGLTSNSNVLGYSSTITPKQVIEFTNEERAKLGLKPLTLILTRDILHLVKPLTVINIKPTFKDMAIQELASQLRETIEEYIL